MNKPIRGEITILTTMGNPRGSYFLTRWRLKLISSRGVGIHPKSGRGRRVTGVCLSMRWSSREKKSVTLNSGRSASHARIWISYMRKLAYNLFREIWKTYSIPMTPERSPSCSLAVFAKCAAEGSSWIRVECWTRGTYIALKVKVEPRSEPGETFLQFRRSLW